MNSENHEIIYGLPRNETSSLTQNLLPLSLMKYHSVIEKKNNQTIGRGNSLQIHQKNHENTDKSSKFKFIWLLKNLLQMELDMNRCYQILETIDFDENILLEAHMNNILNIYFSNQNFDEDNKNLIQKEKIGQVDLISRILFKKKSNDQKNENAREEGKENDVIIKIHENKKENFEGRKFCGICYEEKPLSVFLRNDRIIHEYCKACFVNYLIQKIFSNEILKIKCPDECGLIFSDEDINFILNEREDLYTKYKKFKEIAIINQDPNVIWCVRPKCPGYTKGEKDSQKVVCPLCYQDLCFLCRNGWHPNFSCEEAMNIEFKKYIERVDVKECPKCKSKIEKYEGCNHMTCSRCQYQFCWICLRKYDENHYNRFNLWGCPGRRCSRLCFPSDCRCIIKLLKFLLYSIICIIGVTLLIAITPIIYAIAAVIVPYRMFFEKHKPLGKMARIFYTIGFTICVFILFPIEFILAIVPGTCFLIYLYNMFHNWSPGANQDDWD